MLTRLQEVYKIRAFGVLINKEVNVHALLLHIKRFDSPEGYNALVGDKYKLSQEEYDTIKAGIYE